MKIQAKQLMPLAMLVGSTAGRNADNDERPENS
jgi:hypothetical protein